ncbi:SRPBCC domain-containing protein [Nesterenkonia suensis]
MDDLSTQVHRIFIDAPAEEVWEAITSPELSRSYGYGGSIEVELRPGGSFRHLTSPAMRQMGMGEVALRGTEASVEAPCRLVLDWQAAWQDEPPFRLSYDITSGPSGLTRLVLTHELPESPHTASDVAGLGAAESGGGGWPWVLSSLKTLLETGQAMTTAGE